MIKSYKLKIYGNKGKLKKLDALLTFWQSHVQLKIKMFWDFAKVQGTYPPSIYALGGRLKRDATDKAWLIVKMAKNNNLKKPNFKGTEIDLNSASIRFLDLVTKKFDFWVSITHLENGKRLVLPCKRFGRFNQILEKGKLQNSAKIVKRNGEFYLQIFVEMPEKKAANENIIGLDVGLNNTVATSDSKFFGNELINLRIRTKWRGYKGKTSPFKQGLNRVAKEIITDYPQTDFALENLLFKGKKKSTRTFRKQNNNWAYKFLGQRLDTQGTVEGFSVLWVKSAFTSQTCPECNFVNEANRMGDSFNCLKCGYSGHADTIAAINLSRCGRVARAKHASPKHERGLQEMSLIDSTLA